MQNAQSARFGTANELFNDLNVKRPATFHSCASSPHRIQQLNQTLLL